MVYISVLLALALFAPTTTRLETIPIFPAMESGPLYPRSMAYPAQSNLCFRPAQQTERSTCLPLAIGYAHGVQKLHFQLKYPISD
jgi:hypothetical protein